MWDFKFDVNSSAVENTVRGKKGRNTRGWERVMNDGGKGG